VSKGDYAADQPQVNGNRRPVECKIDKDVVAPPAPRQRVFEFGCLRDEATFATRPSPCVSMSHGTAQRQTCGCLPPSPAKARTIPPPRPGKRMVWYFGSRKGLRHVTIGRLCARGVAVTSVANRIARRWSAVKPMGATIDRSDIRHGRTMDQGVAMLRVSLDHG
jgi:hypothetical protein